MGRMEVAEHLLVQVWKRQLVDADSLVTCSGERVYVIYPGRENRDRGPDFKDAIISTADGDTYRGDVELHSRASDWRAHGHQHDPNYNCVILQVVWEGDEPAVLENGRAVPTLSLRHCLDGSLDDIICQTSQPTVPVEPCYGAGQRLGDSEIGRLLDEAGDERFRLKAGDFEVVMNEEPPTQLLYRGMMGALGYAKNREAFEELASRLPLAVLEENCRGVSAGERVPLLATLLIGKAGLLPSGGSGKEGLIRRSQGEGVAMNPAIWRVFRVRPGNHPVIRLRGAAVLLARFMETGLLEGVLQMVAGPTTAVKELESGFVVGDPVSRSKDERRLIGRGRAREIVINIVLPFVFAWARAGSNRRLSRRVMELYRSYPRAGEYGATRELEGLLLGVGGGNASGVVNSARRQQGLLHLDKTFCRARGCAACPVARRLGSAALAG